MKRKLLVFGSCLLLVSCGASIRNDGFAMMPNNGANVEMTMDGIEVPPNNDEHLEIKENDYINVSEQSKSSFSLDSSSAAYSYIRNAINNDYQILKDAVIIEQMINYFDYNYPSPTTDAVAIYNEVSTCPWNEEHLLASVAVKSKEVEYQATSNNNYVFLIDVSGSMSDSNKLPYVKKGFSYLTDRLNDDDIVSIVTYSGKVAKVLDGVKAKEKTKIKDALNKLRAGGSTAGGSGINMAYELAQKHFIQGGNNQILIATDGDFNVGISSVSELEKLVKEKQETGINFSCFGFGMGNYKDTTMQTLALNGNGNVFYIDSESEIERVFTSNISSILQVVAKDSKIQITFDQNTCEKYRLIGYENKLMTEDEFNDEKKDAGEIYSNKTVVALYEIVPLKENESYFNIDLKYKDPSTLEAKQIQTNGNIVSTSPSLDHIFAGCVAEFGLLLRDSEYKGNANYIDLLTRLNAYDKFKEDYLKEEFISLVNKVSQKEKITK